MGIVCIRSVCNGNLNLPESSISVCRSVLDCSAELKSDHIPGVL